MQSICKFRIPFGIGTRIFSYIYRVNLNKYRNYATFAIERFGIADKT